MYINIYVPVQAYLQKHLLNVVTYNGDYIISAQVNFANSCAEHFSAI